MGKDGRFRLQHQFWLDANSETDNTLAELIEQLKNSKEYTNTIRRGIRIDFDLQRGRLDSLFALYPWVKELFQLGQGGGSQQSLGISSPVHSDLPQAIVQEVEVDLQSMGEDFLDFIS